MWRWRNPAHQMRFCHRFQRTSGVPMGANGARAGEKSRPNIFVDVTDSVSGGNIGVRVSNPRTRCSLFIRRSARLGSIEPKLQTGALACHRLADAMLTCRVHSDLKERRPHWPQRVRATIANDTSSLYAAFRCTWRTLPLVEGLVTSPLHPAMSAGLKNVADSDSARATKLGRRRETMRPFEQRRHRLLSGDGASAMSRPERMFFSLTCRVPAGRAVEPVPVRRLGALHPPALPHPLDQRKGLLELRTLLLQVPGAGHQHQEPPAGTASAAPRPPPGSSLFQPPPYALGCEIVAVSQDRVG